MSIYKPTWLYIKQHNQTKLKYFGMTTRDPLRYRGSGTYWRNHLKIHGNDTSTLWCYLYLDREELVEDAVSFSTFHCIVESDKWANLTIENGLAGAANGNIPWNRNKKHTPEHIEKAAAAQRGKKKPPVSDERKAKQSATMKLKPGRIRSKEELLQQSATRKQKQYDQSGAKNPFFNHKHSDKTKELLRSQNLGKKLSPESIAKREATKLRKRLLLV